MLAIENLKTFKNSVSESTCSPQRPWKIREQMFPHVEDQILIPLRVRPFFVSARMCSARARPPRFGSLNLPKNGQSIIQKKLKRQNRQPYCAGNLK